MVERPEPSEEHPQNMAMDRGHDYVDIRQVVADWGNTVHLEARGEEAQAKRKVMGIERGGG